MNETIAHTVEADLLTASNVCVKTRITTGYSTEKSLNNRNSRRTQFDCLPSNRTVTESVNQLLFATLQLLMHEALPVIPSSRVSR